MGIHLGVVLISRRIARVSRIIDSIRPTRTNRFQNAAQFHPRLNMPEGEQGKIGRVLLRPARENRNLSGSRSFGIRENRVQKSSGLVTPAIERDHNDFTLFTVACFFTSFAVKLVLLSTACRELQHTEEM